MFSCLVPSTLSLVLQNRETATLVLHALKKNKDKPAIVLEWNDAGFNDVPITPDCRNGIPSQTKMALIVNLMINNAINYNDIVFVFSKGAAIGAWASQILLSSSSFSFICLL